MSQFTSTSLSTSFHSFSFHNCLPNHSDLRNGGPYFLPPKVQQPNQKFAIAVQSLDQRFNLTWTPGVWRPPGLLSVFRVSTPLEYQMTPAVVTFSSARQSLYPSWVGRHSPCLALNHSKPYQPNQTKPNITKVRGRCPHLHLKCIFTPNNCAY